MLSFVNTFTVLEKRGKVKAYYKKQELLFEGFNEMETISKSGFAPGGLTEVSPCIKLICVIRCD